jgi:hypothetical protein
MGREEGPPEPALRLQSVGSLPGMRSTMHLQTHLRADGEGEPISLEEFEDMVGRAEQMRHDKRDHATLLRDVLDISHVLTDGAVAMVDDSFMRCFTSRSAEPWNWNFYLFPAWCLGVLLR